MALIKWSVEVGAANWQESGTFEIPDSELAGKDERARQRVIDEWTEGEVSNLVSWGWSELGPDDEAGS